MSILQFPDFPEDIHLCILSFLTPADISSFASTSKRFLSLCRSDSKLWFSLCHRRWASNTHITKWGSGSITFKHLYNTLHQYQHLIGFWRLSSNPNPIRTQPRSPNKPPSLVLFEWGHSFIIGSRVLPLENGGYNVVKEPFLLMGISPKGEIVNLLQPNSDLKLDLNSDSISLENDQELVCVDVNCLGECHIIIEERVGFGFGGLRNGNGNDELIGIESGSPPDRVMSEMYQYFANRMSPGGERTRRQRRRERERERCGNKKWESEHFVKIVDCSPTASRPLQGLWKGICEDASLDFYLVAYDDIGGIACRRIGDSCKPFSGYAPVFWTSNTTFIESPFSSEEEHIYETREHLLPPGDTLCSEMEYVSRILYINSSYDLVLPGLAGPTSVNPHQVEGRIWEYGDGTFGFGFLRDNHIIDLKHIAVDGCLLDTIQPF